MSKRQSKNFERTEVQNVNAEGDTNKTNKNKKPSGDIQDAALQGSQASVSQASGEILNSNDSFKIAHTAELIREILDLEMLDNFVPTKNFGDLNALPTKQYLDLTVIPTLIQGLEFLVTERPAEPINALIAYLINSIKDFNEIGEEGEDEQDNASNYP